MRISMIAAMAQQRVIGLNNQMPWHLPADLQHFKKVTLGKPVVMGRKTFESIGRPLPGRRNIVISRQPPPADSPVEWVSSIEQALALLAEQPEVMIIGGAEIYRQCLPLAQRLYLTEIALETAGDAFFPDYHTAGNWREIAREEHPQSAENPLGYRFITLERQ